MSASANLVYKNFIWRVEAIDPTDTTVMRNAFVAIDPRPTTGRDPRTSSGLTRCFTVTWLGADEQNVVGGNGITDGLNSRTADHRFDVSVYYDGKLKWADVQAMMLSDRHDLIKALRLPSTWVGYDANNSSTVLGVYDRRIEADEVDAEDDFLILRQVWRCTINETE